MSLPNTIYEIWNVRNKKTTSRSLIPNSITQYNIRDSNEKVKNCVLSRAVTEAESLALFFFCHIFFYSSRQFQILPQHIFYGCIHVVISHSIAYIHSHDCCRLSVCSSPTRNVYENGFFGTRVVWRGILNMGKQEREESERWGKMKNKYNKKL